MCTVTDLVNTPIASLRMRRSSKINDINASCVDNSSPGEDFFRCLESGNWVAAASSRCECTGFDPIMNEFGNNCLCKYEQDLYCLNNYYVVNRNGSMARHAIFQ